MKKSLAKYLDHTLLRPDATEFEIRTLCKEATEHQFAAVCVLPAWVKLAGELIKESPCKLCSVVGFPLGANQTLVKVMEACLLVQEGVQEIDMVIHVGALKSGYYAEVEKDIKAVVKAAGAAIVKVIIETCLLTDVEKELAAGIAVNSGAHFVKTSTGFSKSGATLYDVALIRRVVGPDIGVKASGGIRDRATALAMIEAGASRLGTSASVAIVKE